MTPTSVHPTVLVLAITNHLADQLPADRRGWDGTPLKPADRRLYALRDLAGYRGWINRDGYPVIGRW